MNLSNITLTMPSNSSWLESQLELTTASSNLDNSTLSSFYAEAEAIRATVRWVVPFFFGIIAISGFFGNLLVILVVLLNKNMHSTTNLLIVNLAAADLLFVIFCVPFTAIDYVTQHWPFGKMWCRSVQYLIVVTAYSSIYTLVLMSIDRFLAVVHPIRSRMLRTEHITKIAIFTLWTVVLTVSMPVTFAHDVVVSVCVWHPASGLLPAVPECAANNRGQLKFIAAHHRHLVRCLEPLLHVSGQKHFCCGSGFGLYLAAHVFILLLLFFSSCFYLSLFFLFTFTCLYSEFARCGRLFCFCY